MERYDIVVVQYGARMAPRREVFLNETLDPDREIPMAYYFWVIRGEERTVLVDTGYAAEVGRRRGRDVLADPVELFDRLGVAPDTAPSVIVTHAHYDHIGNLGQFERSQLVIARAELDFWMGPLRTRGDFGALTETGELDALRRATDEGRVTAIDTETDLAPGIRLLPTGGHTPGQLMVLVETHTGPVLLASDAIHYDEEIERDRPFTYTTDLVAQYETFDRIARLRSDGALVVAGHDPAALALGAPLDGLGAPAVVIGAPPTTS